MAEKRPTLPDVLGDLLGKSADGLRMCLPAKVVAHNSATGTATVQVSVTGQRNGSTISEPGLREVPVLGWGNYRAAVRPPVLPGDPVLLLFGDRDLDAWKAGRGLASVASQTPRTHDLSDCVALPIMWGSAAVELFGFMASMVSSLSIAMAAAAPADPVIGNVVQTIVNTCNALPAADPAKTFATALQVSLTPLIVAPDTTATVLAPIFSSLSDRLVASGVTPS